MNANIRHHDRAAIIPPGLQHMPRLFTKKSYGQGGGRSTKDLARIPHQAGGHINSNANPRAARDLGQNLGHKTG